MAQLMGGDVSVSSTPGAGTEFRLSIPQFYRGFGQAPVRDVFERKGGADAPLVLIIDDEADARDLAVRALLPMGFAVQGARTAAAGVALARETRPALIVLDIHLPDRDGWSVISELQSDAHTASIPIVISSIEENRGRAIELGAAEHLVKPTAKEQLCAAVMRLARAPASADADPEAAAA
jgi:DNA-binding response OmpR family regulator